MKSLDLDNMFKKFNNSTKSTKIIKDKKPVDKTALMTSVEKYHHHKPKDETRL